MSFSPEQYMALSTAGYGNYLPTDTGQTMGNILPKIRDNIPPNLFTSRG